MRYRLGQLFFIIIAPITLLCVAVGLLIEWHYQLAGALHQLSRRNRKRFDRFAAQFKGPIPEQVMRRIAAQEQQARKAAADALYAEHRRRQHSPEAWRDMFNRDRQRKLDNARRYFDESGT